MRCPFPVILAFIPLRRVDQEAGLSKDVHADDHVIPHVLAVRHRDRDVELPARDEDLGVDHVPLFRLVGRRGAHPHPVEDGPQPGSQSQVRIQARPRGPRVDSGEHPDIALASADHDLFHDANRGPIALRRLTRDHRVHPSVSLPGSIYERRYSINRVILGRDTFFSRDLHRGSNERGWPAVKIGVISKKPAYWSTQAILKSIRKHGHEGTFVKTDEVRLVVAGTDDAVYNGNSLRGYDVLIPRIGRSMTDFGKMLLRQLELMGIRTTLASDGLITARNKFLALQSLRQAHIPIPRSILLASRPNFMEAAHLVRYPAILKILSGTQGIGVMRVKSLEETASIVDTLKFFGEVVCLQEYIPNPGVDIRAFVVGDRVVGSMKRVAAHNEWRGEQHLHPKAHAGGASHPREEGGRRAARDR